MKKSLYLIILLATSLVLSACGSGGGDKEEKIDKDSKEIIQEIKEEAQTTGDIFLIEALPITTTGTNIINIEKSGRLMGSQEITLSAQAGGSVYAVGVKEGDVVGPGRVLVSLADSVGNYGIAVQRARVGLERAQLTYTQTQLQLENAVTNAKHTREQSNNNYIINKERIDQQVRQAQLQLNQAQLSGNSSTALEIQKLTTEIDNQLASMKASFQLYHIQATQLQESLFDIADQLFGISPLYENQGNSYQSQLGVQQPGIRFQTEIAANQYNTWEEKLQNLSSKPERDNELRDQLNQLDVFFSETEETISKIEQVLEFSVGGGNFPDTLIQTYNGQIGSVRASYTSQYATFVSYRNQVNNLFAKENNVEYNTTLDQQVAIVKKNAQNAFENAELQYETTITNAEDTLFQIDLAKTMAEESYDLAIRNKDVQLSLLNVGIRDARVNLASAQKNYAKLTITSPINAIVSDVLVDKGADINMGSQIIKLVGTENNEVTIMLDEKQIELISIGQSVRVIYQGKDYPAQISSIGLVADQTFGYPVTIVVEGITTTLGGTVTVSLPIQTTNITLPLQAVELIGNSMGYVYLWNNNTVEKTQVEVGAVRGDRVEILTKIDESKEIIISDMSSHTPEKRVEKK